jgi:hypothetical protein
VAHRAFVRGLQAAHIRRLGAAVALRALGNNNASTSMGAIEVFGGLHRGERENRDTIAETDAVKKVSNADGLAYAPAANPDAAMSQVEDPLYSLVLDKLKESIQAMD